MQARQIKTTMSSAPPVGVKCTELLPGFALPTRLPDAPMSRYLAAEVSLVEA